MNDTFTPKSFDALIGPYDMTEEDNGQMTFSLTLQEKHMNQLGITHGGLLLTLMDAALGAAAIKANKLNPAVTIELSSQFLGKSKLGDTLIARGTVHKRTRHLLFVSGSIQVKDKTIMTGAGIWKIIRPGA